MGKKGGVHEGSLAARVASVKADGNLAEARRLAADLQNLLGIAPEALAPWLQEVEDASKGIRASLGGELKAAAEDVGCQFDFRPPYVSMGCVTLHEVSTGTWNLSVLDGVTLESLHTHSAATLAQAARRHIDAIQETLSKARPFAKTLVAAYDLLRQSQPDQSHFSPNLLMALPRYGRGLKKELTSAVEEGTPLSRAQFGFLLSHIHSRGGEWGDDAVRLDFKGATQHVTRDPFRFVSLPGEDDPRRSSQPTPISSLKVVDMGGQQK